MKKLIPFYVVVIAVALLLWSCTAGAIPIMWDANTDDTVGYKVYYGNASGNYGTPVDVGNVTTYVVDVLDGNWYIVVTAYDAYGNESGYSNEVSTVIDTIPPMIPGFLRIGTP